MLLAVHWTMCVAHWRLVELELIVLVLASSLALGDARTS